MATTFAAVRPRIDAERRFYRTMAWIIVGTVLVGFAPSWFLRGLVPSPRPNTPMDAPVVIHGLLCTLWLAIFWVQTQLVSAGRRDLHMRLGVAGAIVALLIIPFMYLTMVGQPARGTQPPGISGLGWTAVPMGAMLAYSSLVLLGLARRRDVQAHKRLLLSATLVFMGPAVGRIPLGPPTMTVFALGQLLGFVPFYLMVRWDRRSIGRIHWATQLGAGLTIFGVVFGVVMCKSPLWEASASYLPGI